MTALTRLSRILLFFLLIPQLCFGAVVEGTNAGFVTSAPVDDPDGTNAVIDTRSRANKFTSPAGSNQVTSLGWYCDTISQEANFEVGIYSHDAVDDEPNVRLTANQTNAKGTTAGWKTSTLASPYELTASTAYWLAYQLDDTATTTNVNYSDSIVDKADYKTLQTTLTNPWGDSTGSAVIIYAIYALYSAVPTGGARSQLIMIHFN